jgi:hypothetical protein
VGGDDEAAVVLLGKAASYAKWEQTDLSGAAGWDDAAARDQREADALKEVWAEPRYTMIRRSQNAADRVAWFRQRAAKDARLKRLYERAASQPWRAIDAD